LFDGAPILHVTHDLDDHGWQFLGLEDVTVRAAHIIPMQWTEPVGELLPGHEPARRRLGH
jgi:hypothetical protein